jgi:uncharacterized membrane protein YfbV (UPF0208 family)
MPEQPSGSGVYSPKIADQALVRRFVSQYGSGYIAIEVTGPDGAVDADEGTVQLQVWYLDPTASVPPADPRGVQIIDTSAVNHPETGKYDYEIGPEHTANRGTLTAEWTYEVGGTEFKFVDNLQILNRMPTYDALDDERKLIIEQVSWMIGDFYDSQEGGPHLIDEFQTKFDYERIAQLMGRALTRMNLTGFPVTNWTIFPRPIYPPSTFTGLLAIGTYLEVIRHLRDSYVEIPNRPNMNVVFTDRRDYTQRWAQILATELPEYQKMVKMQKRDLLQLGKGALLVAGGVYGGGARGLFMSGTYAAQTRAFRFYPAAPAIAWSSRM